MTMTTASTRGTVLLSTEVAEMRGLGLVGVSQDPSVANREFFHREKGAGADPEYILQGGLNMTGTICV
jgi:hypothetical protein